MHVSTLLLREYLLKGSDVPKVVLYELLECNYVCKKIRESIKIVGKSDKDFQKPGGLRVNMCDSILATARAWCNVCGGPSVGLLVVFRLSSCNTILCDVCVRPTDF